MIGNKAAYFLLIADSGLTGGAIGRRCDAHSITRIGVANKIRCLFDYGPAR